MIPPIPARPEPLLPRPLLAGLALVLALAALDQNIVSTALPRIASALGGVGHLSSVASAYLVANTVSAMLYGRLSDLHGRRPALLVAICLFLLGSAACGLSRSMDMLICCRAVQGLGAGGLLVLVQTVVGDLVPPRERSRIQGWSAGVFAACSVAGPLVGGLITERASWRWIFDVNLPIGAAALAIVAATLPPARPGPARSPLDLVGIVLLTAATSTFILAIDRAAFDLPAAALLSSAATAGAMFLHRESCAAQPILPLVLFRDPVFAPAVAVVALSTMALFTAAVFLPLTFQLLMRRTPSVAGLMVSPMMGGLIAASIWGGRFVSRTGRYGRTSVAGLGLATCSYALLALDVDRQAGTAAYEIALVLVGVGIGLVQPHMTTAIQNAVEPAMLGGATATLAFLRSLGGATGVSLAGAIVSVRIGHAAGTRFPAAAGRALPGSDAHALAAWRAGLADAFAAGALIAACGLLVARLVPERPLRASSIGAEGPAAITSPP